MKTSYDVVMFYLQILLEKIIAVASGEKTKAMELEQNDFIPWKRGISL